MTVLNIHRRRVPHDKVMCNQPPPGPRSGGAAGIGDRDTNGDSFSDPPASDEGSPNLSGSELAMSDSDRRIAGPEKDPNAKGRTPLSIDDEKPEPPGATVAQGTAASSDGAPAAKSKAKLGGLGTSSGPFDAGTLSLFRPFV